MATTTTTTTASRTPTATPAVRPALGPFPPCPPVVGTMGIDVTAVMLGSLKCGELVVTDTPLEVVVTTWLLKAGAAGEDGELGTREPASLSGWVNAVEALSPLLVKDTWPK